MSVEEAIAMIVKSWLVEGKEQVVVEGVLDIIDSGHGFLRYVETQFKLTQNDVYIPKAIIKQKFLRYGDKVRCVIKDKSGKYLQADEILEVNDKPGEGYKPLPDYRDLTAIFPNQKMNLNYNPVTRLIDLISPQGFGQRTIIASPPKCGKTSIIEYLAQSISKMENTKVFILLLAERPEEFSYIKERVSNVTVLCSSFDEPYRRHVHLAELVTARCLRMAEAGVNVVLFLDSLTRFVRAVNLKNESTGKILSGGLDSTALLSIKSILGMARNFSEAGSLSILGTMLIGTESRMDEVIHDESKGTSNSDITLNEKFSSKGLFPGIDVEKSGTRRAELMMTDDDISKRRFLRQVMLGFGKEEALSRMLDYTKTYKDNDELLNNILNKKQ